MVAATKFQTFVEALAEGLIDLDTHTFKVMLTNTAPNAATDDTPSDITEIAAGNGYTAGGATMSLSTSAQSGGVYRAIFNDLSPAWTATGAIGPFRYFVLFDDTTDRLVQYWDRGSSLSLANGDTLSLNFDGTNGVLSIT